MNEWVKRYTWEFPHKRSVFTAPDEHMHIIQLHIMSIQPANKTAEYQLHITSKQPANKISRTSDQFIIMTSLRKEKTEVVNAYSYKEQ